MKKQFTSYYLVAVVALLATFSLNAQTDAQSKITFYTDQGKSAITEGAKTTLSASKDLLAQVAFTKKFTEYSKVVFYFQEFVNLKSGRAEVNLFGDYQIEYKKSDFKNNKDISLWVMKPGPGAPSSTIVGSDVEGRGDFMAWVQQGQYAWFYISPKTVLPGNKKQDRIIVITATGYNQTGTKVNEYYDVNGKLVKETVPVYDDGTVIVKSDDFVIVASK